MAISTAKLLDKVTKLIALTSSPNREEARTSAYQACKLIRENKLSVVTQASKASTEPVRAPAAGYWDKVPDFSRAGGFTPVETSSGVVFCNAKFSGGQCGECGELITKGSRIVWYPRKRKTYHQACADKARKRA